MPGPGTWAAGDILTAADLNAIGTWTSYTPVVTQNGARTATINYAKYCKINKLCIVTVDLEVTNAGTTGNQITISLPVNNTEADTAIGSGFIYDASATDIILISLFPESASTVRFISEASTDPLSGFGVAPAFALASGDVISFTIAYQAA